MRPCFLMLLLLTLVGLSALATETEASSPPVVSVSLFASFSSAVNSSTTAGKTIIIDKAVTVNNTTIADRSIKVINGGSIYVTGGKILAINGPFEAGMYQVFTGSGTVSGLSGTLKSEWWPATTAGMQSAINACESMDELLISTQYNINSMMVIGNSNCTIRMINGAKFTSNFLPTNKLNPLVYITGSHVKLIDFHLDGNNHKHRGITVGGGSNFSMIGGKIENLGDIGIVIGDDSTATTKLASTNHMIDGVEIHRAHTGIYVASVNISLVKDTTIQNCHISNGTERGINFGGYSGVIANNHLDSNAVAGIYVSGGGTKGRFGRVTVENNRVTFTAVAPAVGTKISAGTREVRFANNYIDMTAVKAGGSNYGLLLQGASNVLVSGNSIFGGNVAAINVQAHPDPNGASSANVIVKDNLFNTNSATVVAASGGNSAAPGYTTTRTKWLNNTFSGTYLIALSYGADYSEFIGNTFSGKSGTTVDLLSLSGTNLTVKNNHFSGMSRSAVRYELSSTPDKDYVGTVISENVIKETSKPASGYGRIQLVSPPGYTHKIRDTLISGNSIDGGSYGILTTSGFSSADNNINTIISNNQIYRTIRDGMLIRGINSKVTGNTVYDVSQGSANYSSIQINGDGNTVTGNIFKNSGRFYRHVNVSGGENNNIENNFLDSESINDIGKATNIRGNKLLH